MDSILPLWPVILWIGGPLLTGLYVLYRQAARDGMITSFLKSIGYGLLFVAWFLGAIYLGYVFGD